MRCALTIKTLAQTCAYSASPRAPQFVFIYICLSIDSQKSPTFHRYKVDRQTDRLTDRQSSDIAQRNARPS